MALSSSWIELLNGTLFSSQPQSDTVYLILIVVSLTAVLLFFTAFAFSLFAVRWRHNVFNKLWPSRTLLSCCIALTAASIFLWYPLPGPIPFPPVNVSLGHRNLSIRKVLCIASVGGTVGVFSPLVSAITYFSLWGLLRNGQRLDPSTILKSSSLVWLAAVLSQGAVTSVTAIFLDEQYSGIFEYFVAGTGVCRMPVTNLALYITYDAVLTSLSYSKCHKLAASHTKNVVYTKRMKELGWSLLIFAFIEYLLLAIGELLAISSQAVLQEKDASVVMLVQAVMSSTALLFLLLRETVVLVVRLDVIMNFLVSQIVT
mmetsp:Transcript_36096/g.93874  ORF Transcript_36096/g.93874 Transcript_36096/m.93874 type:complete len:315 (-) Transcript_36096:1071-2015(-)